MNYNVPVAPQAGHVLTYLVKVLILRGLIVLTLVNSCHHLVILNSEQLSDG